MLRHREPGACSRAAAPRAPRSGGAGRFDLLLIAPAGVAAAITAAVAWTKPLEDSIQSFVRDDSFYYLETARRLASGDGPTFDGLHPTNGFHPLWMMMLVPVFRATGNDRELGLRVTLALQAITLALPTLLLLGAAGRRLFGSTAAFVMLGVAVALLPTAQTNGMESGVLLLLAAALVYAHARWDVFDLRAPPVRLLGVGCLLGMLFLARSDSVFLIVAWGIVALARVRSLAVAARAALAAAGLAVVTGPYLIWNVARFGHLLPISAALKTSLPALGFRPDWLDLRAWTGFVAAIVLGVWVRLARAPAAASFRAPGRILRWRWASTPSPTRRSASLPCAGRCSSGTSTSTCSPWWFSPGPPWPPSSGGRSFRAAFASLARRS